MANKDYNKQTTTSEKPGKVTYVNSKAGKKSSSSPSFGKMDIGGADKPLKRKPTSGDGFSEKVVPGV